ncbi:MAG: hypothetical protein K9N06_04355 [Candidatus Cloacimonetes bacterium]|nr:hypothetical protein [Candidatus Cloacimonadota bacterium]
MITGELKNKLNELLEKFTSEQGFDELFKNPPSDIVNNADKTAGVYIITVKHCKKDKIDRLLGSDMNRILYIGQTGIKTGLWKRLRLFYKSATTYVESEPDKSQNGHCGGKKYFRILKDHFGSEVQGLNVRYHICIERDEKKLEAELISTYLKIYGEVPPLNGVIPKLRENSQ